MPALTDPKYEAFACFVAQGKSKREAAVLAGYSKKSASTIGGRLSKRVDIGRRIQQLRSKVAEKTVELVTKNIELEISSKQSRNRIYDDLLQGLRLIKAERAADQSMQNVPGGKTGLIVRQMRAIQVRTEKVVKRGNKEVIVPINETKIVPEYTTDTGLVKAIQSVCEQAAIELGQWKDGQDEMRDVGKVLYQWVEPVEESKDEIKIEDAAADSKNAAKPLYN